MKPLDRSTAPALDGTAPLASVPDAPTRPTFLYIGMPKAASSWMFEIFREHPEVYVPVAKNIEFFDRNYHRGFDWYLENFRPGPGIRAIGELSHDYYVVEDACARIRRHLPDVKLICCLREPGEFVVSSYNFTRMHELKETVGFRTYANNAAIGQLTQYKENLRRFYKQFPTEQIKIVFFDDVRTSPRELIRGLYQFVGVDPSYRPRLGGRKVNAARLPRSRAVTQLAFSAARNLRQFGLPNLVGLVKRNRLVESLLYRQGSSLPDGAEDVLSSLRARCRAGYPELEDLIGRPLPRAWYDVG